MQRRVVVLINDPANPFGTTHPKRAKQLVNKGRAEWINEATIRLRPGPSDETRANDNMNDQTISREEWTNYFKQLVERVVENDQLTREAIQAIVAAASDDQPNDTPAHAIGNIFSANQKLKSEAVKALSEFVTRLLGAADPDGTSAEPRMSREPHQRSGEA